MAEHSPYRFVFAFLEVVEVAFQVDGDDEAVSAASRPSDADLLMRNTDAALLTQPPSLQHLTALRFPHLDCLITASGNESLAVRCPADSEDAPFVLSLPDLLDGFSGLAVV
ncbi:hypothetical protein Tdes44962_MAKER04814 [Teratosphaeria destructans]|uniref:Uncharacterized protein n=1 Tax=Teratosphaeria destructans TaxID=418781 RepID=A0A9W7SL82_9PEZI|nr:hypothetical protein Tdes44962_MAKER04814 [Teratosphaeria destructans]